MIFVLLCLTVFSTFFLKRSANTSMGPSVQHVAYIGITRHGKTEACISRNGPRMLGPKSPAFLVLDPAGPMAEKLAQYLAIHGEKFMFDAVASTDLAPGYGYFPRSMNHDLQQKKAEDRQMISEGIGALMRSEGKLNAQNMKATLRALSDAFLLYIYQKEDVPFYILKDCFTPETDNAQYLLKNCTNPEVVLRFQFYHGLHGQQLEYHTGSAERRLVEMCDSPQFQRRCQQTFDLADFFNSGGKLLMSGRSLNNLSREDAALVMGTTALRVIALARAGKITRPLVILLDEGLNTGLLDLNVARALRQSGQWGGGVEWHLLLQNVTFGEPEIMESVLGNCDVMYYFKQVSPAAAEIAAKICGTMTYDPLRIKEIVTRIRQIHVGVEIKTITHVSKTVDEHGNERTTTSEGHYSEPKYGEMEEKDIKRMTFDEQLRLMAQRMMTHHIGCCTIKEGVNVVHFDQPLPMLEMPAKAYWPWKLSPRITLAERKLAVYLDSLTSHPAYQPPEPFSCTIPKTPRKSIME